METGVFSLGMLPWIVFTIVSFLSLSLGVVLVYHLFKYATNATIPYIAAIVYFGVSLVLIVCLLALAFSL